MNSTSLTQLVADHLAKAETSSAGRSAHTVYGGQEHSLRQTLIALAAGEGLDDHESPGEATLQVLHGRVRLATSSEEWEGGVGEHLILPLERHNLKASESSAVLLTVAIRR